MVKETSSNIKKKRKTANTEAESDTDIYKKVIDFEEKEALNSQGSIDASIYFGLCQDIRKILAKVFEIKQVDPNSSVLKELQTEIFINMSFIKKLNRTDKLRHVHGKETLSAEKQKCDSIKLNYQNLVYELHHLVTETNKCLAFKSKDEDIELVSFEDFMKEAPESLTKKFLSYDANDREQKHNLRLARLEWELTQRKNLAQLCKSLVEEQKKLSEDLIARKDKLNALRPLLMNVINSTKPLQEHLDISLTEMRVEHKLAYLLPDPLYIFYVNVVSYKNVYDLNLDVEIIGDQDEAIQWKESKMAEGHVHDDDSDTTEIEQDAAEAEEIVEVRKRRHRKSVQQVDPMEEKKRKLLECHPLKIQIVAKLTDGPSLTVTFSYQTILRIVTVMSDTDVSPKITGNSARDVLIGENILRELIEGDDGLESPNPMNKFQIKKVGITSFQSLVPDIGYAYHWAQKICGRDFISKQMDSDEIGSINVQSVMKLMFKRLESRYQLATQLQQLENSMLIKLPNLVNCPITHACSISKWTSITYQKYCQLEFTKLYIEEEFVTPSDLIYCLQLTRLNATLDAYIVIKSNYPITSPIISICVNYNGKQHSENNDDIRDIERKLNADWEEPHDSSVLSVQIAQLCSCFDVYLETTDPNTFTQTVTFIKSISARNRRRPLKFRKIGNGIFTQY
ncbi:THO complex subunit 5 homolog [Diorhabda sublineata]|uniref:THO complex subunit 5 homolog n=1 Tax=Diorhabda sublineata TaxID=1163346 RepID=UPI0024E12F0D|nr:THO complex subunit 5 homolog [Diorhabda sublineata]